METIIRPARPEDLKQVAELIYLASQSHLKRSIFDILFDTSSREASLHEIEKLFISDVRSWHHWSHFFVSEVDGEIAASLCAYTEEDAGIEKFQQAFMLLRDWTLEEIEALMQRVEPFTRAKPPSLDNAWIIEYVATFSRFQRHGLSRALFETALEKGRLQGLSTAQITFIIGNVEAQRAYEKLGFTLHSERRDEEFERLYGAPGMRMMVKAL